MELFRRVADSFWGSAAVAHNTRWELTLPSRVETLAYMEQVLDRVLEKLSQGDAGPDESYFHWLVAIHEDIHREGFTYQRHTMKYSEPMFYSVSPAITP